MIDKNHIKSTMLVDELFLGLNCADMDCYLVSHACMLMDLSGYGSHELIWFDGMDLSLRIIGKDEA